MIAHETTHEPACTVSKDQGPEALVITLSWGPARSKFSLLELAVRQQHNNEQLLSTILCLMKFRCRFFLCLLWMCFYYVSVLARL